MEVKICQNCSFFKQPKCSIINEFKAKKTKACGDFKLRKDKKISTPKNEDKKTDEDILKKVFKETKIESLKNKEFKKSNRSKSQRRK
jgi:hypothetical protein